MTHSLTMEWEKNWDPAVGLWWVDGPGHTAGTATATRRHVVPAGGGAMVIAGQLDQMSRLDTHAILRAIRSKQNLTPGPRFGNVCFHWQDPAIQDGNAGFFLGQSLAVVGLEYADQLPDDARATFHEIVRDLATCMNLAARGSHAYYPNKHLGDIVVAHLLSQVVGDTAQLHELDALLVSVAKNYLEHGWGWGEDMSDIYSKILLDEVSLMLCVSRRISDAAREACVAMLRHLVLLDDLFAGGPRVPAIRTYDFLESSAAHPRRHYRDIVQPWTQETLAKISHVPQVGPLLHSRNWHTLAPPRAPIPACGLASPDSAPTTIRLSNQRVASARITPDLRLGCVSRFPIMDSAEHHDWGLAWQSMPVTMSHQNGDWAFLQWFTQTAGNPAAHPAMISHKTDPTRVFRSLSPNVSPPIVGKTYSLMQGGGIIAMRILPAAQLDWEHAGDRFRIVAPTATLSEDLSDKQWPRLSLVFPGRTVGVSLLDPWRKSQPTLSRAENLSDWAVTLTPREIAGRRGIVLLWAIHPDGLPAEPPTFTPVIEPCPVPRSIDEQAFVLDWKWPTHHWRLVLDPLSATPLTSF